MILDILKYIGLFILLLLIQMLILDKIYLGINNQFTFLFQPFIIILFVLLLPANTNHLLLIFISFLAGAIVDINFKRYGINASIFTFIGFVRYYITIDVEKEISSREEDKKIWTSKKSKSWKWTYFISFIFIYHFLFTMIDTLGKNIFTTGILTVIVSTIISFFIVLILEDILFKPSKN